MNTPADLARTMQRARYEKGLSIRQLHALSGVAVKTITRIEAGKGRPHGQTIFRLAPHLDLDGNELLDLMEVAS